MAEIVNLRQARKHKRRSEKQRVSAEKRGKSGRSGSEKLAVRLNEALREKRLDAHRIGRDETNDKEGNA